MAEQYFAVPLGGHRALLALQRQCRHLWGETPGANEWQSPRTLHLTLVFVQDDTGGDLSQLLMPDVRPFVCHGRRLLVFDTDDGAALGVGVELHPLLQKLQTALVNECLRCGVGADGLSPYSLPKAWEPHVTLGYLKEPVPVGRLKRTIPIAVRGFVQSHGDYHTNARFMLRDTGGTKDARIYPPLS